MIAGTRSAFTLANAVDASWASIEAVAGRSYCAEVAPGVTAVDQSTPSLSAFRSDSTTGLSGPSGARTCFISPLSETALFRTTQSDPSARPHRLAIVETTLWANWYYVGGDYSSFTILRNTTNTQLTADLQWRNTAGTVVGTQLGLTIPANGTVFFNARDAMSCGFPTPCANPAGSVEIAHNGEAHALEGSQTTLSATSGLSFDTVMQRRTPQ